MDRSCYVIHVLILYICIKLYKVPQQYCYIIQLNISLFKRLWLRLGMIKFSDYSNTSGTISKTWTRSVKCSANGIISPSDNLSCFAGLKVFLNTFGKKYSLFNQIILFNKQRFFLWSNKIWLDQQKYLFDSTKS